MRTLTISIITIGFMITLFGCEPKAPPTEKEVLKMQLDNARKTYERKEDAWRRAQRACWRAIDTRNEQAWEQRVRRLSKATQAMQTAYKDLGRAKFAYDNYRNRL